MRRREYSSNLANRKSGPPRRNRRVEIGPAKVGSPPRETCRHDLHKGRVAKHHVWTLQSDVMRGIGSLTEGGLGKIETIFLDNCKEAVQRGEIGTQVVVRDPYPVVCGDPLAELVQANHDARCLRPLLKRQRDVAGTIRKRVGPVSEITQMKIPGAALRWSQAWCKDSSPTRTTARTRRSPEDLCQPRLDKNPLLNSISPKIAVSRPQHHFDLGNSPFSIRYLRRCATPAGSRADNPHACIIDRPPSASRARLPHLRWSEHR